MNQTDQLNYSINLYFNNITVMLFDNIKSLLINHSLENKQIKVYVNQQIIKNKK